jgi:hypothetical protein
MVTWSSSAIRSFGPSGPPPTAYRLRSAASSLSGLLRGCSCTVEFDSGKFYLLSTALGGRFGVGPLRCWQATAVAVVRSRQQFGLVFISGCNNVGPKQGFLFFDRPWRWEQFSQTLATQCRAWGLKMPVQYRLLTEAQAAIGRRYGVRLHSRSPPEGLIHRCSAFWSRFVLVLLAPWLGNLTARQLGR